MAAACKGERDVCPAPGESLPCPFLLKSFSSKVEEEKEELGKMVVKARKELVATLQLQLEEAREQMQEEEEFVVCK